MHVKKSVLAGSFGVYNNRESGKGDKNMENKKEQVLDLLEQMQDQAGSLVRRKVTYFARPATEMLSNVNTIIDLITEFDKRETAYIALVDALLSEEADICSICAKSDEVNAWLALPENDVKMCPYYESEGLKACRKKALEFFLQKGAGDGK